MRTHALVTLLCLSGAAGLAIALRPAPNSWSMTARSPSRPRALRSRLAVALMKTVEKQFGAPANRHPTVGKPPITRWDYAGFSVFFEGDRVIDTVATAADSQPAGPL